MANFVEVKKNENLKQNSDFIAEEIAKIFSSTISTPNLRDLQNRNCIFLRNIIYILRDV